MPAATGSVTGLLPIPMAPLVWGGCLGSHCPHMVLGLTGSMSLLGSTLGGVPRVGR